MEQSTSFQEIYQAGIAAFERGEYRLSIQQLEQAIEQIPSASRQGGEAQIWLVSAYQGGGKLDEARNLCQKLTKHPNLDIRKQAKQLLYILDAPRLKRPQEWMTNIPDLGKLPDSEPKYQTGSNNPKNTGTPIEPMNLEQQKNTRFIWVALVVIGLILGGLVWFNYSH